LDQEGQQASAKTDHGRRDDESHELCTLGVISETAHALLVISQRLQHAAEQEQFAALKRKLDEYAKEHGFANQIQTVINQRGLVIRLLTDRVLFPSGSATLKPQATPLASSRLAATPWPIM